MSGTSHKDAATSHLKVFIIDTNNPYVKITTENYMLVKKTLMGKLKASCSKTKLPTFRPWMYFCKIIIIINVLGLLEVEMAKNHDTNLNNWKEITFALVRVDEFTKNTKLAKAYLWIIRVAHKQNPNSHVMK